MTVNLLYPQLTNEKMGLGYLFTVELTGGSTVPTGGYWQAQLDIGASRNPVVCYGIVVPTLANGFAVGIMGIDKRTGAHLINGDMETRIGDGVSANIGVSMMRADGTVQESMSRTCILSTRDGVIHWMSRYWLGGLSSIGMSVEEHDALMEILASVKRNYTN